MSRSTVALLILWGGVAAFAQEPDELDTVLDEPHRRGADFGRNLDDARDHCHLQQTDFGTHAGLASPTQYGLRLNLEL